MQITSGKTAKAQKVVVYGPEGIGKTTFAAGFPSPLFIDTEGSTKHMDVRRLPNPESWNMLMQEAEWVRDHPQSCATLVIDTADWAESLCMAHICALNKWASIESPGYGKGFTMLAEEFGRLLNLLTQVIDRGVNVVVTAHAIMRKFEQPDELGAYDRWELKLQKKTAPMVKEWADLLLFANYKTFVVNVDNQGAAKGKNKAQGGQRVMYTTHHPAWDAKNRVGLAEELLFQYSEISAHITGHTGQPWADDDAPGSAAPEQQKERSTAVVTIKSATSVPVQAEPPKAEQTEPVAKNATTEEVQVFPEDGEVERPEGVPDQLWQLMQEAGVKEEQLRYAVFKRGYYPYETPIPNYDDSFIKGVLIGAWPQVHQLILDCKDELPF